ncbi:MAG: hypothetical protein SFV21_22035, partial [Rhodospirillaceae bacterium]|nr:hypothetical protein [Rhodospirillaceae bacterium]
MTKSASRKPARVSGARPSKARRAAVGADAASSPAGNVLSRIRAQHRGLGPSAIAIADFILAQPSTVMRMSVTELAEAT